MWGRVLFVAVVSPVLGAVALAAGCTEYTGDFGRNCTAEELAKYGCGYCPVTCAKLDGGVDAAPSDDAGGTCEGECVTTVPVNWFGPVLLWTGPAAEVPECPQQALKESGYTWHGDLQAPPAACGACACEAPVGSCTLPVTFTTSSAICPGSDSGSAHISFNAPVGWNGVCTSIDAIPSGELCGGSPCVKSITLAPLDVTEGPCTPMTTEAPMPPDPSVWGIAGKVCRGSPPGKCSNAQDECVPEHAPGFKRCVYHEGDKPCADETPYTDRHVLYTDMSDARGCAACTCGDAVGSACVSSISIFEDGACSVPIPFVLAIDAIGPKCVDLPPGVGLGSKSAGPVIFTPGTCQPAGGGPTGSVEPLNPTTYCCLPDP